MMKEMMNNWWKTILQEDIDPTDYHPESDRGGSFYLRFPVIWQKRFIREKFIRDIIRVEILPWFKSLPPDMKRFFYKDFTSADSSRQDLINWIENQWQNNHRDITHYFSRKIMLNLLRLFASNKKEDLDLYVSELSDERRDCWESAYHAFYSRHEDLAPNAPPLRITKSILKTNLAKLQTIYPRLFMEIKDDDSLSNSILSEVEIIKNIGSGYFGQVFSLSNGRALKIFRSGVNLQKDVDRMNLVISQVYGGSASLEDMHYFEHGKIGRSSFFYAVMPRIIPLSKLDYQYTDKLVDVADNVKFNYRYVNSTSTSLEEFKQLVMRFVSAPKIEVDRPEFQAKADAIIKAGYRAIKQFGGEDLHGGNIGFLPQKPEVFFYYDM